MKKIFYLALLASGLFVSCNSYLDVKPKGFTIPELVNDYRQLLGNQALIRASPAYPDYISDNVQSGDLEDVNSSASFNSYATVKKNLYTLAHGAIFEDGDYDPYWESAYSHIFTYNVVINNVLAAKDGTAVEKNRLWAEAKIGRAFEYLTLVNIYAAHYKEGSAASDLGLPLVLSEDINKTYDRVSVKEIYDLVETDLEEALPHLAVNSNHNFQALKSVGFAFLSRMNLYKGNYQEALKNAQEALKLNSYLEDYSLYTNKGNTTWGRVCLKTDDKSPFPDVRVSDETVWGRLGTSSYGALNAEVYASADLIATYKKDLASGALDKRYDLFFCRDSASFGARTTYFPGRVLWAPYVEINTGFSTGELYLTAAECQARIGSTAEALTLLNTLRDSRIEKNVHFAGLDKTEALRVILDERRREMPYVGSSRLIDLKRLHVSGDLTKNIEHRLGDKTYEMSSSDARMILPVPPKVLSLNPSIPQYER